MSLATFLRHRQGLNPGHYSKPVWPLSREEMRKAQDDYNRHMSKLLELIVANESNPPQHRAK